MAGLVPLLVHVTEAGHVTVTITENGPAGIEKWVAVAHFVLAGPRETSGVARRSVTTLPVAAWTRHDLVPQRPATPHARGAVHATWRAGAASP